MIQTCRRQLAGVISSKSKQEPSHAGLLLSRYLEQADGDGNAKRTLLEESIRACKSSLEIYKLAFERLFPFQENDPGKKEFSVKDRLVIGLGSESVLETGLTLHHTYGTPIILGAALKGLASHYCSQVWGKKDSEFCAEIEGQDKEKQVLLRSGKNHHTLFGDTDDAGHIIFHDAWMTPDSLKNESQGLALDVMTPHHRDYYRDGSEAPTDFDKPIPITFLSVTGTFWISVSCDVQGEVGEKWKTLAMTLLGEALKYWGIGGKTSSGYGRMEPVKKVPKKHLFKIREQAKVIRIEDPKGKGRFWFQDGNGIGGVVVRGRPPQIEIGEETTLWVTAQFGSNYNFSTEKPKPPRQKVEKKKWR